MKTIRKMGEKACLIKKISVTKWFHGKAYSGLEAVANQVLQVWVTLCSQSVCAATRIISNDYPICKKFSNIKPMEIQLFSRSEDWM